MRIGILLGDDIGLEVVPECVKVMKAAAARERLVLPSGNDGLILAQPVSGFASMVQRKGLAMVRLK